MAGPLHLIACPYHQGRRDAHADLDTPEDNVSGYFDVMALAMAHGQRLAGPRG